MLEIRWHGRGGQGAKTAALLLADVAFAAGLYVQGFPEYGPERMGAPVTAYNRFSTQKLTVHSNIYEPDIVVVVDETLIGQTDICAGIKNDGLIIINTISNSNVNWLKEDFGGRCFAVDASGISKQCIGRDLPNTALLAVVVKLGAIMEAQSFFENMKGSFEHKFASKPEVIEGNLKAIHEAWEKVKQI